MKIEQKEREFKPVTITLETKEELETFHTIILSHPIDTMNEQELCAAWICWFNTRK